MEGIDFKAITEEVAAGLSNIPLEMKTGGWPSPHVTKYQVTPDFVRSTLIFAVWVKVLDAFKPDDYVTEPMAVEKTLAVMMRRGLVTDIRFKNNSFTVTLANSKYRIYKYGKKEIYACPWTSDRRCEIPVIGAPLADYIMRFDEEIPAIVSHVPTIMKAIMARELEETKRLKEKEIKDKLIQSLIDQYLKPLGLSARYEVDAGDIVSLDLRKVMSAHIEMPLGELADKLKNTAGIADSLSVETPDIEPDSEYVDFSGLIP